MVVESLSILRIQEIAGLFRHDGGYYFFGELIWGLPLDSHERSYVVSGGVPSQVLRFTHDRFDAESLPTHLGCNKFQNNSRAICFLALDIRVPPEVWCFSYVFGVQIPSQEAFGCLGGILFL